MLCVTMSMARVGKSSRAHKREELGAQVLGGEDVERGERFVHEQGVGFDDERAGEADALAHPAGELLGVGGLEAVEADEVDGALGAVASFGARARCGLRGRARRFGGR